MTRLPIPGKDNNSWGAILNDFLEVAHSGDGLIRNNKVQLAGDLDGTAASAIIKCRTTVTVGQNADYNFNNYASSQAAIQAAIDASSAIGATVVINCSCTFTASVNPKSNVHITCLPGVVITFNSGHVNGVPASSNDGFHAFETSEEISNFSIYGLRFNGGLTVLQTGEDGAEFHAIYIRHGSHDFTVKDIYGTRVASGIVRFRDSCYGFTAKNIEALEADCAIICTVGCNNFTLNNVRAVSCFAEGLFLGSGIYDFTVNDVYANVVGTAGLSINNSYTPETRAGIRGNISNIHVVSAALQGVNLYGCDELNLSNIYVRDSNRDGVLIYGCNNITVNNVQSWNSNRARVTDGTSQYVGLKVYNSKSVNLNNAICDDDGDTVYQYRGISCEGTSNYVKVTGGRSENTISSAQTVVIGSSSTAVDHSGYNPRRYHDNGNVSAAPSLLLKNGDTQRITLTQNSTLAALDLNAVPGQTFTLIVEQNSTGGWTLSLPSNAKLIGGDWSPSTTAGAVATISFMYISSGNGWYEVSRSY